VWRQPGGDGSANWTIPIQERIFWVADLYLIHTRSRCDRRAFGDSVQSSQDFNLPPGVAASQPRLHCVWPASLSERLPHSLCKHLPQIVCGLAGFHYVGDPAWQEIVSSDHLALLVFPEHAAVVFARGITSSEVTAVPK
jgi:hypothetical protein